MNSGVAGLAVIGFIVWCLCSGGSKKVAFHGHGDTRARAWNHEKRHQRILRAFKVRIARIRVWEERDGWHGTTQVSQTDFDKLSPEQQAAVYMAGAMGAEGNWGCEDDLAAVDARTSRSTARRIARRYL
jgi:hypothetical protein